MRMYWRALGGCLLCAEAQGEVHVWVGNHAGKAVVNYRCTAGEVVRAFALDVRADKGQLVAVSEFYTGPCTAQAKGYGIFPSSFKQFASVQSGSSVNWGGANYTPLANPADSPGDTLPGLNSAGVTLEIAALWDASDPANAPNPEGTLCALELSEPATVSLTPNQARGGVVSDNPDEVLAVSFSGAWVGPAVPRIIGISITGETLTISFEGGELVKATELEGPWVATGNRLGQYSETIGNLQTQFYRVQAP